MALEKLLGFFFDEEKSMTRIERLVKKSKKLKLSTKYLPDKYVPQIGIIACAGLLSYIVDRIDYSPRQYEYVGQLEYNRDKETCLELMINLANKFPDAKVSINGKSLIEANQEYSELKERNAKDEKEYISRFGRMPSYRVDCTITWMTVD